jgi:ABC-2 type transport system permease protein
MKENAAPLTLESGTVGGMRYLAGVFPALLGRNADMWIRFRVSMVMDLLNMAAQASLFFLLGHALGAGGEAWTRDYAAFLAVGLVFTTFLDASLNGPYQSLSQNYWSARLESILSSPCPVWSVVLADTCWTYVRALLNALVLGGIGYLFGARIQATPGEVLLAVLALGLAISAVLGFGLMSAAMFMLINAKGFSNPVAWLVSILQGLVAGAYFPISELPGWLQVVARMLPQTYGIDAARRLLLPAEAVPPLATIGPLSPLASDFAFLIGFAVTLPVLGYALFAAGMRKAQADGGLSRWA